jgi:iron complex outermembrane recepter protein
MYLGEKMPTGKTRIAWAATASAIAVVASPTILAQVAEQAQDAAVLEEVTVVARRVEEDIQRVPIPITVLTPAMLSQQDVTSLTDVAREIPGVSIYGSGAGSGSFPLLYTRGLNGTVSYFADVPKSAAGFATLFDLQNYEVLKGPQGTLFGLASNAGALLAVPQLPGNDFGGYLTASGGNLDHQDIQFAANLPLLDGRVLVRLAAESYHRQGWVIDLSNGDDYGGTDYYTVRPSMVLKPTDNVENYTLFQYNRQTIVGSPQVIGDFNFLPPSEYPNNAIAANFNGGNLATYNALRDQILGQQEKLGPYQFAGTSVGCPTGGPNGGPTPPPAPITSAVGLNRPDQSCDTSWAVDEFLVNKTTWNFTDNFSLKNIFGLSWGKAYTAPVDNDQTKLVVMEANSIAVPARADTIYSDEIQIAGKLFDRLNIVTGVFHNLDLNHPVATYGGYVFAPTQSASMTKTSTYDSSVYGQGTYDLRDHIDGLTLTAGYRYSWDGATRKGFNLNPATLAVIGINGGPGAPGGAAQWSQGSYTLSAQYQVAPQTMVYLANSKGFSAGGLQNVVGFESYAPSSLNNLELGTKSTFSVGGMTVRIDASGYYGFYDNVQVTTSQIVTNATTGVKSAQIVTANAAQGRISGVEATSTVLVTNNFEVGGFASWIHDKYTRFASINPQTLQPIDISDSGFTLAPKWKYGFNSTYHFPMDRSKWGDVSITGNYSYEGQFLLVPRPYTPVIPGNPNTGFTCTRQRTAANGYGPLSADGGTSWIDCSPPTKNLNLALDWKDVLNHDGLSLSLIVDNVTDEWQGTHPVGDEAGLGYETQLTLVPRTFVVQASYKF